MSPLYDFLMSQSHYAHYYIFCLLVLAGFCFPVSEDLVLIAAAIISVRYHPENMWILFLAAYIGAYVSDVICYALGRKFGRRLLTKKPFSAVISKKHIQRMERFYEKHNFLTLFLGRFIPFGVRNAVFFTAGMSRMNFAVFLLVDAIACTLSTGTLFMLGRIFAYNIEDLFELLSRFRYILIVVVFIMVVGFFYLRYKKRKHLSAPEVSTNAS